MTPQKMRVLAVDDNDDALFALGEALRRQGFEVLVASSGAEALRAAAEAAPDAILLDLNMPGMDGFEVTRRLKSDPALRYIPVVLLTALGEQEDIVRGLDQGADDYMTKPFRQDELIARLRAAMRTRRLYAELQSERTAHHVLREQVAGRSLFESIIGESPAMAQVFTLMSKVKDTQVPVLILGESGTGKELIARALHYNGPRRERPFVVQNCSAFNENLLESELFGHVKGAFTGAVRDKEGLFSVADSGTFFLDELGEMSPALQVKLLRVLQQGTFLPVGGTRERKVDVRIVAATNRDLPAMVASGAFREDLYYRINVVTIRLPALRERRGDIPLLIEAFLRRHAEKSGSPRRRVSAEAAATLGGWGWPGNIRELENEIERMLIMAGPEEEIGLEAISPHIREPRPAGSVHPVPSGPLPEAVEALERSMIASALDRLKGNKSEAARELGISRSNLIAKAQAYGLGRRDP